MRLTDGFRKTWCIGITGGVGSGKSSVIACLKERVSCRVFCADEEAKKLYVPQSPVYDEITAVMGTGAFDENGEVDKKRFAERLYGEPGLIDRINAIVHPAIEGLILDAMAEERISGKHEFFFVEAALLIECGYEELLDEIWYVYASEAVRRERLKASRGYDDERIDNVMKSQLTDSEFRAHCRRIIDNDGSREKMMRSVNLILEEYR